MNDAIKNAALIAATIAGAVAGVHTYQPPTAADIADAVETRLKPITTELRELRRDVEQLKAKVNK
jgi:ABC-type transporter Mla subunit MlaD